MGDACDELSVDTKKAKIRWHHSDIHLDGKLNLPPDFSVDTMLPTGDAIITLAGVEVANQNVSFETKGKKNDKWEYKDKKNLLGNIKEFKVDWKEAKFDYKGNDGFHIHTHDIGGIETTLCIHTGKSLGAFEIAINGTTIAYDENKNITTSLAYDPQKDDNSHVHFTLPFQLTPEMAINVSGALNLDISVKDYFDEATAKFTVVCAFEPGLFDGTSTVPDTLEFEISLGDGTNMISGNDAIGGENEKGWTKKDLRHWEYK